MKKAIIAGMDGNADPGVTRAFSLHDAAAPSIDAASSLRDRPRRTEP